jgi:hypothetical protein
MIKDAMMRRLITDRKIQEWVQERHGFLPTIVWIAHCRRLCGLAVENLSAYQQSRFKPCPLERQDAIIKAFRYFGMLPDE